MPIILSDSVKVVQMQPTVDVFANGSFYVYSGTQPANPRLAPSGTLLGTITRDSNQYDLGAGSNGVTFLLAPTGYCTPSQQWFLNAIANGVAGWVRWITRVDTLLAAQTLPRVDFAVNELGSLGMDIGDPNITAGSRRAVTYCLYGIPPFN